MQPVERSVSIRIAVYESRILIHVLHAHMFYLTVPRPNVMTFALSHRA